MGKAGQKVNQAWTGFANEKLLAVGVLNDIGADQADFIRLQNLSQMSANRNRNGSTLGNYSKNTRYRQGKVDLNRTGKFYEAITSKVTDAKIKRDGVATIEFEISVPTEFGGRVKGFRTGRYGKSGKAKERPVLGIADVGTALRTKQEKELKRIAKTYYETELGNKVQVTSKDF